MNFVASRARRFIRDENGLVMTEFLVLLPLLLWCFMALFVYWDAFRTINEGQKAAYAVSDLLSRQADVNRAFIGGMDDIIAYLLVTPIDRVSVRVTSIQYDAATNRYRRLFSESPSNKMPRLTEAQINAAKIRDRIPNMADGDTAVIVETIVRYVPPFVLADANPNTVTEETSLIHALRLQVPAQSFGNFVVTRPRNFRVCLDETPCPAAL